MTTPLIASWRIEMQYLITGQSHRVRVYVRDVLPADGSFTITERDSSTTLNWVTAGGSLQDILAGLLPAGTSFGSLLLQQHVGILWQPVSAATHVGIAGSGTVRSATEITLYMRDSTFKPVKVSILDTNQTAPEHWNGLPTVGQNAVEHGQFIEWTELHTLANAPWMWQVGRSNNYLAVGPIVGITTSLNRKSRRREGLA
jgi:hypothetical protein